MLNWIWFGMMAFAALCALAFGRMGAVSAGILDVSEKSVMNVMLPQAGFIALWMGVIRLVEKSGMIGLISRIFSPILRLLFPGIPAGHPALGAIALNLGASMLGAGNAATPAGLRAMHHMQKLNPHPTAATNEMCMLLALSTAAITLIPASTVATLASMKSTRSTDVILPAFLATVIATTIAIIAAKLLQRLPIFAAPAASYTPPETAATSQVEDEEPVLEPLPGWKKIIVALMIIVPVGLCIAYVAAPDALLGFQRWLAQACQLKGDTPAAAAEPLRRFTDFISTLAIPYFIAFFVVQAALKKVPVFQEFVEGAKDGVQVTLRIIPYVVGILVAIRMLRDSGGLEVIQAILKPLLSLLQFPVELLPMAIIRPLSGGAARGVLADIATAHGPDHWLTMTAATINGSADTTFYVAAVYFGAVGIKYMRHAIAAGLIADFAAIAAAVGICSVLFAV